MEVEVLWGYEGHVVSDIWRDYGRPDMEKQMFIVLSDVAGLLEMAT